MNPIILQQLRNTLIDGKFPSEIVKVKGVSFKFTLTDDSISRCITFADYIEFLSTVISCPARDNPVPLTDLPGVYLVYLQDAYSIFQYNTMHTLLKTVTEFIESDESHGLWLAYKNSDPSHVLSIDHKLNVVQRRWVTCNAMNDKTDNMKMIMDIFEAAKPWLDKELYKHVKEEQDVEVKENAFFDDADYDTELREKAKRAVSQRLEAESESDTVIMNEDEN